MIVVVAINKTTSAVTAAIALAHSAQLAAADVYTLTSAQAAPVKGTTLAAASPNSFSYTMPARSVSTLVLHP